MDKLCKELIESIKNMPIENEEMCEVFRLMEKMGYIFDVDSDKQRHEIPQIGEVWRSNGEYYIVSTDKYRNRVAMWLEDWEIGESFLEFRLHFGSQYGDIKVAESLKDFYQVYLLNQTQEVRNG